MPDLGPDEAGGIDWLEPMSYKSQSTILEEEEAPLKVRPGVGLSAVYTAPWQATASVPRRGVVLSCK